MPELEAKNKATIMFWNLKKNPDSIPLLSDLINQHSVDICVVAEFPDCLPSILDSLKGYDLFRSFDEKTKVRYIYKTWVTIGLLKEDRRWSMLNISIGDDSFNLVGCHLKDCINYTPTQKLYEAIDLSNEIREKESQLKCDKTLVVGDLNMNPFEIGVSGVLGLNAVMDINIAKRITRRYDSKDYPYFYNPMWYFMGHPEHANGTINYSQKDNPLYWNMFDQVLLRPSLTDKFNHNNLKIITNIGNISLLNKNGLIDECLSDHLPIYITIQT